MVGEREKRARAKIVDVRRPGEYADEGATTSIFPNNDRTADEAFEEIMMSHAQVARVPIVHFDQGPNFPFLFSFSFFSTFIFFPSLSFPRLTPVLASAGPFSNNRWWQMKAEEQEKDASLDGNLSETSLPASTVRDRKWVSEEGSGRCNSTTSHHLPADGDRESLPLWCSRPFCRSNTQSEPEDFFGGNHGSCSSDGTELNATAAATALNYSEDEDELLECHRGCPEYYYLCSRGGGAHGGASHDELEAEGSRYGSGRMFEGNNNTSTSMSMSTSTDASAEQGGSETVSSQPQSSITSLRGNLALILFVALPMLARHLGALVSKRLLARLYRS